MSLWSRIKNAAKKVWRAVKTVVRVVVKAVVGLVMRVLHMIRSALDLIYMVKKKMRIQVFILRETEKQGLVPEQDLDAAISTAKQIFLDRFKVEIRAYGKPIVQTLPDIAPAATRSSVRSSLVVRRVADPEVLFFAFLLALPSFEATKKIRNAAPTPSSRRGTNLP